MSTPECKQLSDLFFQRYWGVRKFHDYIARQLKSVRGTPYLTTASGHRRYFFGRPDEILTKAVASEAQHNTTYATNLALNNLWNDKENREGSDGLNAGSIRLKIEPLHQVHDALCGGFWKSDTTWAISKIKSYFNNTLRIAQQDIIIPFDGAYGESWGNLKEGGI